MTHRSFISIILAAAIAITGMTAAPAQARDRDDIAKWIAGAAALAIIGSAIAENRRDDSVTRYRGYDNNFRHYNKNKRYSHGHKKHYKNYGRNRAYELPSKCVRKVRSHYGEIYGYGRRCMLNNYSHFNSLPHDCVVQGWNPNGQARTVYNGNCLSNYGYYLSDRR